MKLTLFFVGIFAIAACDDAVKESAVVEDGDGDGWAVGVDCNDDDPGVHPDGEETCNGADDDCNGLVDDEAVDAAVWYEDADGDGFGDVASGVPGCDAGPGRTSDATDCNDGDAMVFPGASETCDGRDENCDGAVDESGATGDVAWFPDTDGDGYGDSDLPVLACGAPAGHGADGTDCDDADADVSPGSVEICDNGRDDDCAADVDDCRFPVTVSPSGADAAIYGEARYDSYGVAVDLQDLDDDGVAEFVVRGGIVAAEPQIVVFWDVPVGEIYIDEADFYLYGVLSSSFIAPGDITGDGLSDLVLCSGSDDTFLAYPDGSCFVAEVSHAGALDVLTESEAAIYSARDGLQFGYFGLGAGDTNGDGVNELLLTDPDASGGDGAVYLFPGPLVGTHAASEAAVIYEGTRSESVGTGVAAGEDTNGDGLADVFIGSYESATYPGGVVYLFQGPLAAIGALTDADAILAASAGADTNFGEAIKAVGDLNGDGYSDMAASVYRTDHWSISLFQGPFVGIADLSTATADLASGDDRVGATGSVTISQSMDNAGDTDGDGFDDLLVGAPLLANEDGGAFLAYGPFEGVIDLLTDAVFFSPENAGDNLGFGVAGGDIDADGLSDIVIGAPGVGDYQGAAYLFYGRGE